MVMNNDVIIVTEAAAFQINTMIKESGEDQPYLRVSVHGGGCSSLSYGMNFEQKKQDSDIETIQHEIHFLVNKEDAPILTGTRIDYKQSMLGGGFTIENPNAIATCGCGSSFRTAKVTGNPEQC